MKKSLILLLIFIWASSANAVQKPKECPSILKIRGNLSSFSSFDGHLQICPATGKDEIRIDLGLDLQPMKTVYLSKKDWETYLNVIQQEYDRARLRSGLKHSSECRHPISVSIAPPGQKSSLSFIGCEGSPKQEEAWWSAQRLHDLARHLYFKN